ncbi:MAG TPA: DUF1565 domain-containing protein, partial [Gemmataceae bacterium]|nr:DUF1565 domain-containing protein [Gemmataceae bacterium]
MRKPKFRPRIEGLEGRLAPAVLYVSTTGSDSAGVGSITAPFATLTRGIAAADPGDHIVLRGGTYAGPVTVTEPDITI